MTEELARLDRALRDRLNMRPDNRLGFACAKGAIQLYDAISRLVTGRSFFCYRECAALLGPLEHLHGRDLLDALLALDGGTRIVAHGLDHVPQTGAVVIASTHPTGAFDMLAHAAALLDRRPDLKVVAIQDVEVFLGPDIVVPVRFDKSNRAVSGDATRTAMTTHLDGGGALLIFGSGRVPDRQDGRLIEPDWKSGTTRVSDQTNAPIVPAALDARNSPGYYRTRAIARWVSFGNDHFGAMIGSLRYFAEVLNKLGGTFDVHYARPCPPGTSRDILQATAEALVQDLYVSGSSSKSSG